MSALQSADVIGCICKPFLQVSADLPVLGCSLTVAQMRLRYFHVAVHAAILINFWHSVIRDSLMASNTVCHWH